MIVADGTKVEEFTNAVADYLTAKEELKELEAKAKEANESIKGYLTSKGITEAEVSVAGIGEMTVKLIEMTRETVNTAIAKTLIPKKYLDKEGVLTHTTFQQLTVKPTKA
jgi:hypothetical protein